MWGREFHLFWQIFRKNLRTHWNKLHSSADLLSFNNKVEPGDARSFPAFAAFQHSNRRADIAREFLFMKTSSFLALTKAISRSVGRKGTRQGHWQLEGRRRFKAQLGVERLEARQLFASLAYDPTAQTAIRDQLLNGVAQIADMGSEGTVAVFGEHALSVLQDSKRDTVVAAMDNGTTRIIAAAKTGFAQFVNPTQFNTSTFYLNSLNWLSRGAGTAAIIVTDNSASRDWLVGQGFANVTLATNWQTNASIVNGTAHVLITSSGNPTAAQQAAATNFLAAGRSLFTGYNGWAYTGNTYAKNAPANAILRPFGLSWTDDTSFTFDGTIVQGSETGNALLAASVELTPSNYSVGQQLEAVEVSRATFDSVPISDPQAVQIKNAILANVSSLVPTPSSIVSDANEMIRLRIESAIMPYLLPADLFVHRTASSYGAIPVGSPRVSKNLTFNVSPANSQTQWLSTGLYAAPGETISVTVPASLVNLGWTVKISSHDDDVTPRTSFMRMPYGISRDERITSTSMQLGSVYGGMIYFVKPTTSTTASYSVTVSNAMEAPYFVLGQTTDADWISSIRNLSAPQAELVCSGIIISMHSSDIRALNNPTAVMTYWQNIVATQDDLTNSPVPRLRPERIDDDLQISNGSLHAGYPIAAFGHALEDMVDSDPGDDWGFFHEIGHNHQADVWNFSTETEVSVNIMSMRSFDSIGTRPSDNWDDMWSSADRASLVSAFVAGGRLRTNAKQSLTTYAQLYTGFGWEPFRQFFRQYQTDLPANLPTTDQQERDQWVTRFSNIVGKNLGPFLNAWGFGASTTALNAVALLPAWSMLEASNPNPTVRALVNSAVTIDPRSGFADIMGDTLTVTFSNPPARGTLNSNPDGSFTYTPPSNWTGSLTLPYTIANMHGGSSAGTVTLNVINQSVVTTPIDTDVSQQSPNTNRSLATSLFVRTTTPVTQPSQMLLQFSNLFGSAANQIPSNAVVTKATLQLQVTDAGGVVNFHRMLRPWSHTDTWNTLINGVQTDGVEAASSADLTANVFSIGALSFDLTNSVQTWLATPASNNGWLLNSTVTDGVTIASAESTTPPRLIVEYYLIPTVQGRQVFYNRSSSSVFGNGSGNPINSIDPTKVALLPGQTASFSNVTNYSRGLNGIVVDLKDASNLAGISAASFEFATWSTFPDSIPNFVSISPSVTVSSFPGGGVNGSDRLKLEFANNAIQNAWLRVTVLADANTGLPANDVFYFGNARFDVTPTSPFPSQQVTINAFDVNAIRAQQGQNPGVISNIFDVDRNGIVNAFDTNAVRAGHGVSSLRSFMAPSSLPMGMATSKSSTTENSIDTLFADSSWLESFQVDYKKTRLPNRI